jgi:hypothetical protein
LSERRLFRRKFLRRAYSFLFYYLRDLRLAFTAIGSKLEENLPGAGRRVMGMFSKLLDGIGQRQFAKDENGRTVFFPRGRFRGFSRGRRRACYYVDAADESKLRSLVKMYALAGALINFTGSMASLGFTEALAFDHGHALPEKLKLVLIVYLVCAVLFSIGPVLILWRVYQDAVAGLCAPLAVADPESLRLVPANSSPIRIWIAILVAAILLGVALFLLLATRHKDASRTRDCCAAGARHIARLA